MSENRKIFDHPKLCSNATERCDFVYFKSPSWHCFKFKKPTVNKKFDECKSEWGRNKEL